MEIVCWTHIVYALLFISNPKSKRFPVLLTVYNQAVPTNILIIQEEHPYNWEQNSH